MFDMLAGRLGKAVDALRGRGGGQGGGQGGGRGCGQGGGLVGGQGGGRGGGLVGGRGCGTALADHRTHARAVPGMKPVRLRPHEIFLPRPGAPSIRYARVAGWFLRPGPEHGYVYGQRPVTPAPELTEAEVADWAFRWGATCSDRIARVLAGLEKEWGPRFP